MIDGKRLARIYLILVVVVFSACFIVINATGNGNRSIAYELERIESNKAYKQIIRYYTKDNDIYEIVRENEKFSVVQKKLLECDSIRCDEEFVGQYNVKLSDEALMEEYIFFGNFFKDNEQVIKLDYDDYRLTTYTLNHIKAIILQDEEYLVDYIVPLTYEIVDYNAYGSIRGRGYFVDTNENGDAIVVIGMGSRNTGGYSLQLKSIVKNYYTGEVVIGVIEHSPEPGAIVTQAFTYPTLTIKLNYKPSSIKVINVENNSEFTNLKED